MVHMTRTSRASIHALHILRHFSCTSARPEPGTPYQDVRDTVRHGRGSRRHRANSHRSRSAWHPRAHHAFPPAGWRRRVDRDDAHGVPGLPRPPGAGGGQGGRAEEVVQGDARVADGAGDRGGVGDLPGRPEPARRVLAGHQGGPRRARQPGAARRALGSVRHLLLLQRDGVRDVAGDHGAAHERAVLPRGGQGGGAHAHHLRRPRQPRRRLHRRTTRYATSCVYIVVITCVSFICVVYIGEAMGEICAFVLKKIKCMRNLAKRKWFPVPAGVVTRSLPDEEAEERRKTAARSKRPTCCLCCGQSPTTSDRCDVEVQ
ncbi:hypothetical protein CFC21_102211 [Triticum aestivum]|uniref:Uncharacterized protein n=2 Tax=Triticum aestivum TaxID=4565 RepID=A0A9R1M4R2_WHEAT|nr:hypothetical protein CFC21_102204 [Triticum aestivum]KAF7100731.1 hypothetical protein CFC21_102209 [Triticum aestivum]KAF7100733.1 hypothetical protein CFC21_102211 [Triticum aestivum]